MGLSARDFQSVRDAVGLAARHNKLLGERFPSLGKECMEMRMLLLDVTTRVNELEVRVSVAKQVGELGQVPMEQGVESLPLFEEAQNVRARLVPAAPLRSTNAVIAKWAEKDVLASRHREGDHTMDPEEGGEA